MRADHEQLSTLEWLRQKLRERQGLQAQATLTTLHRFRAMLPLIVPLHLGLSVWFAAYEAPVGQAALQVWASAQWFLHMSMFGAVLIAGACSHLVLSKDDPSSRVAVLLQAVVVGLYFGYAMLSALEDVRIGTGMPVFAMVMVGIAAMSLMGPVFSGLVFLVGCGLFAAMIAGAGLEPWLLSSLYLQLFSSMLISMALSVLVWIQFTSNTLLHRTLTLTNQDLQQKQQELEFLAGHDTLTGLYNRREFLRRTEMELARVARVPAPVALMMLDLDHFKRINDEHGHPVGDEVLRQVAAILNDAVRATDIVGRMGGEEFIVLLPNTTAAGAQLAAQKLLAAFRARPVELSQLQLSLTASVGVTALAPHQRATANALYLAADQALYLAKENGRNRIEFKAPALAQIGVQ